MANLPKKLKILTHTYKVIEKGGMMNVGERDPITSTITIEKALPDNEKWATLFHEILHVIDSGLDESTVDLLAQVLYCVLKENKLLKEDNV